MFIEHLMQNTLDVKKHLEKQKLNEMIIPEWLFQEPIENEIGKIYNPKPLRQVAEHYKLDLTSLWKVITLIMPILN